MLRNNNDDNTFFAKVESRRTSRQFHEIIGKGSLFLGFLGVFACFYQCQEKNAQAGETVPALRNALMKQQGIMPDPSSALARRNDLRTLRKNSQIPVDYGIPVSKMSLSQGMDIA